MKLVNSTETFSKRTLKLIEGVLLLHVRLFDVPDAEYAVIMRNLRALQKSGELAKPVKPQLITRDEASQMLTLSESEFRRLESQNYFPFQKVKLGNKTVRYRLQDVSDFIEADRDASGQITNQNDDDETRATPSATKRRCVR